MTEIVKRTKTFEKIKNVNSENKGDIKIFVFEGAEFENPEIVNIDDNIYLSDYNMGIVKFKNGEYRHYFRYTDKSIGDFKYGLVKRGRER